MARCRRRAQRIVSFAAKDGLRQTCSATLGQPCPTRCDPLQEVGSERAMKGRELMQFCWGAGSGSRHGAEPARACSYGGGVPRYVIAMAGNRIFKRHRTPQEWA